jgi:hypothetical protein
VRRATGIFLVCLLLAISASLPGCKRSSTQGEAAAAEQYAPTEGSVGLDIISQGGSEASRRWLGTYTDDGRTTRFSIEVGSIQNSSDPTAPQMGKGAFTAETDSDPIPLLDSLKKALRATRTPTNVKKVDVLPFDYLLLGENQTRSPNGTFSPTAGGNWTVMKIFLANDQAEVYFNFNPVIHKAEFAIKDATYGDRTLAELAKIL